MIRAVLIAAVAGFSWPYFVNVSIPNIPPRHEIGLNTLSNSSDTISTSQVVNRSQKSDKLNVVQSSDAIVSPAHNTAQTTLTPNAVVKIAFEQFGQSIRMTNDDVVDLFSRVNVGAQLASALNPANSWHDWSHVVLTTVAKSRRLCRTTYSSLENEKGNPWC